MSLAEIKNNLYRKEAPKNLYERAESEYDARSSLSGTAPVAEKFLPKSSNKWGEMAETDERIRKIITTGSIVVGVTLLLGLSFLAFLKVRQWSFDENRVLMEVQGPEEIQSGSLAAYEITFKNNNRATLKNAVLQLSYPENFLPENNPNFNQDGLTTGSYSLQDVLGGKEVNIVFYGRMYGWNDNLIYLKADLSYTPSVASSSFVSENQFRINIVSSAVRLEIAAPQKAASGDKVEYAINYKNIGNENLQGIAIRAEYPEGFVYSSSAPEPSEGKNIWNIENLTAGQEGKIIVSGKLNGEDGNVKVVRAYVEKKGAEKTLSYTEEKGETQITQSSLSIMQVVNGRLDFVANPGEILNYEVAFRNNMSTDVRDLIVTEKIESSILDYGTLNLGKSGSFDMQKKVITWKAADNPQLKLLHPGEEGRLSFSVKVKDVIPVSSPADKNFVISNFVRVDSEDIPAPLNENQTILGNSLDIKLNSKVILESLGSYKNDSMENSGPMPPVVGQGTTYSIRWRMANVSNDLRDAKVEAVLPTNVSMTGKIVPENTNIKFNERNNTVVWEIGDVPVGVGVISAPWEVVFQIKLTPFPGQAGSSAELIGESVFTAKDLFTDQDLKVSVKGKTTTLPEDPTIQTGYKVSASE